MRFLLLTMLMALADAFVRRPPNVTRTRMEAASYTRPPILHQQPWPTLESGAALLHPSVCLKSHQNCSFHGSCAIHGNRTACFCTSGFHGNFCEIKTTQASPYFVLGIVFGLLALYICSHVACVCYHMRRRSFRRKAVLHGSDEQTNYGATSEHCTDEKTTLTGNNKSPRDGLLEKSNGIPPA